MRSFFFWLYVFCFLIVGGEWCFAIVLSFAVFRDYYLYGD
jgi:hypothetical protein